MWTRMVLISIVVGIALTAIVVSYWRPGHDRVPVMNGAMPPMSGGPALAEVKVPQLTTVAEKGKALFETNCAVCHGMNAAGSDGVGPPLVHVIYEPNHHGDAAFQRAVAHGVRAHHWRFGDMPPVSGVTPEDVEKVTAYIRQLQRANGIF